MLSQIVVDRFLRNKSTHEYCLHAHEKLILFFLASYMGQKKMCYPSIKSLAIDCSLSIDSIKRSIKFLEKKGLIKVERITGCNNRYVFNLPIINQLGADSTQCPQHLDAYSTTHQMQAAPKQGAHSTSNNISNNIKEFTSLNICEVETSPVHSSESNLSANTQEIFNHWLSVMNHPRAKLDNKRRRRIAQALKLGFSIAELKQAIDGCSMTPHNMGKNESNQIYDDISLILRDAEHIERFINNADGCRAASAHFSTDDLMAGVI